MSEFDVAEVRGQRMSDIYEQGWDEGRADQAEALALLTENIRAAEARISELTRDNDYLAERVEG